MIYLDRSDEPMFWKEFRRKHPHVHYDELQETEEGKQIRREIRSYNVEQQHFLCAYCCRSIDIENSLNEHIKPKGIYSNLSMDYNNIVASCKTEGENSTCSASKKDHYKNSFVSPLDKDCELHFFYYQNGEIGSDTEEGSYTINLLNLNSYKLCRARKAQLQVCNDCHDNKLVWDYFMKPDSENKLQPFVDIVRYFYREDEVSSNAST